MADRVSDATGHLYEGAALRWAALVRRRREQMEAAEKAAGLGGEDYWAKRAPMYQRAVQAAGEDDAFLRRVLAQARPGDTVLDVGAGTGRYALPLARHVSRVVAVDPSAAMLGALRKQSDADGITNIDVVESEWMPAAVDPADIAICSHVLYPIEDVVPFVRKFEQHARRAVFVYLRVDQLQTDFGLWPEFYGEPLMPQPTYMDLLNVLAEMDVYPDVEISESPFLMAVSQVEDAMGWARANLYIREDDSPANEKLHRLLADRLTRQPDDRLALPTGRARAATLSWHPG
jgi:SAM-dependent methyltransferase